MKSKKIYRVFLYNRPLPKYDRETAWACRSAFAKKAGVQWRLLKRIFGTHLQVLRIHGVY